MAIIDVKPTMRTLRTITMFLIIPGLPMIIPTAVLGYPVILAGFAPYSLSLVLGIAHRECNRRKKEMNVALAAALDLFVMLGYLGSLLPMWTGPGSALHRIAYINYWNDNLPTLMLFCYASSVYVANMVIHLCLTLMSLYLATPGFWAWIGPLKCSRCRECPRCSAQDDEERRPMMSSGKAPISITDAAQYSLLGDADETPRPSEEAGRPSDETIREV